MSNILTFPHNGKISSECLVRGAKIVVTVPYKNTSSGYVVSPKHAIDLGEDVWLPFLESLKRNYDVDFSQKANGFIVKSKKHG